MREPVWPEPGAPAPAEKPPLGPVRIQAALTPEEWAEFLSPANKEWAPLAYHMRGSHAAAATNLYGQPFGFTHEDVRKLRAIGGQILTEEALLAPCTCGQVRMKHGGRVPPEEGFGYGYHYAECNRSRVVHALPFTTVEWAAKLADRIAALLPPEVPNV